jgi:hypothetical protein
VRIFAHAIDGLDVSRGAGIELDGSSEILESSVGFPPLQGPFVAMLPGASRFRRSGASNQMRASPAPNRNAGTVNEPSSAQVRRRSD